ncbi:hypothetical protein FI667_g12942, partial [Globisporangium splendens]
MATSRRNVVLHFDLNRTVLMSDAAGGRTMENTVDYLLSECSWGYVHPQQPSKWVCVSEASSIEPPAGGVASVAVDGESVAVPLITYKQFVDDSHPYESLNASGGRTIEQIKALNKAAKKQRTALQSAFTGGDGPGARVRGSFHEVMDKLHFPEGRQREAAKQLASTLPTSRLQEAWSEGKYYLLPSFMQFLSFLTSTDKTDKYAFKLVFRTFGDDIPEVAKELELLVDGKHPFYPAGTKLPESFKLDVSGDHVGTFYRDGYDANGTALAVGTLTKLPFSSANQGDANALANFYEAQQGSSNVQIVRGFGSIQSKIADMLNQSSTLALRDYWEWWSAHAENGEYGKLLLVNDSENDANDAIVVFFDDHIEAHHSHIVDVRDVATGNPVPFEKSKRKYLQRVEPFAAITDPSYFITLVEKILQDDSKL